MTISANVVGKFRKKERIVKIVKSGRAFKKKGWTSRLFFVSLPLDDVKPTESERNFTFATENDVGLKNEIGKLKRKGVRSEEQLGRTPPKRRAVLPSKPKPNKPIKRNVPN